MPQLRLNEHYVSIQGEGPNVGVLTQFVRFSGCNMRCAGWPCDTQYAIQPALYRNDPKVEWGQLVGQIYRMSTSTGARHVCLTGGEPFMQDANRLANVAKELLDLGFSIDIFTNGSFPFPGWIWRPDVTIVLDWKLPGSGESETNLDVRRANAILLRAKDAIKFTVKDKDDLICAQAVFHTMREELSTWQQMFVGRVWDEISDNDIIEFIKANQLPWRLNVQLHKYLWPNVERGI